MQHEPTGREPNCVCRVCGTPFYTKPSQIRLRNGGQHCSRACHGVTLSRERRGENHPSYKGADITVKGGHQRAEKLYRDLGGCERCGAAPAVDRHHKNGNTADNRRENIAFLCRRCHMLEDGRLAAFVATPLARRKLTDDQAREIWQRLQELPTPTPYGAIASLAREYGVSDSVIHNIRAGRNYRAAVRRKEAA